MHTNRLKIYWVASIAIAVALVAYVGWTYATIRSVDHHLPLIALSYRGDSGWLGGRIAGHELERRTSTREFDGVMVLSDILTIAFSNKFQRDKALGDAKRLMDGPVNVNSLSRGGLTPVHIAIASNNEDVLRYLLGQGADPRKKTALGPGLENQLDAFQYLDFLKGSFPAKDWSRMDDVLGAVYSAL